MPDKGISTAIEYNYLNLPEKIVQSGNATEYTYRSDGEKLQKTFTINSQNIYTDYLDGFVYNRTFDVGLQQALMADDSVTRLATTAHQEESLTLDDKVVEPSESSSELVFFPTSEGFYDFENSVYIYQYKDHLGNVRLSYSRNSSGEGVTIKDMNSYYPFGLNHYLGISDAPGSTSYSPSATYKNYKYNGKELQETGMYDYGARFYMPDIGRWGTIDPLAETSRRWSTYHYAYNNPIMFIDPDGREGLGWGLKDGVWSWDKNLTADNYQQQGFSEYKEDGSVISNATIQGQSGEAGSVYLGFNGQAQSIPEGGATSMLQLSNFTRDAISSTLSGIGSAINALYDVWMIATFSPDPNMNLNTPSATTPAGKALEMAGSVSPLLGAEASGANKITEPVTDVLYKRPNNATTAAQRAAVQGEPCVTCGAVGQKNVADHIVPLVKEHYQTGTINQTNMRSLKAVQHQCEACSAQQGAAMSKYSKEMKKIIQQRTNGQ